MKITVTNKHITRASKLSKNPYVVRSLSCPVALACTDVIGAATSVSERYIRNTENYTKYSVPRSVKRFINRFDANKPVESFTFILKELN